MIIKIPVSPQLQASVDHIRELILAAQPDADPNCVGGIFDAYGEARWTPSRPAGVDFSSWGVFEVWEHQEQVPGALKPSGAWAVWNAETGEWIAFNDKPHLTAREQAELTAAMCNAGKPTRVVEANGGWSRSMVDFGEVQAVAELAEMRSQEQ